MGPSGKRETPVPVFLQIKQDILTKVRSGELTPGERLSDERTLAREYRVSRDTIRRALRHLSEERVIDRIQGNGTYIRAKRAMGQRVAAIFYGTEIPGEEYVLSVLSVLDRQVSSGGGEVLFRPYTSEADLRAGLRDLNAREDLLGGLILSANTPQAIGLIRELAEIPLVIMGDLAAPDRMRVVLDQVVGSNYPWARIAAKALAGRGCERLALVLIDQYFVWTKESAAGFTDGCGEAGVSSFRVHAFHGSDVASIRPPDPLAMIHWAETVAAGWRAEGWMPQGVVAMTPWLMRVFDRALGQADVDDSARAMMAVYVSEDSVLKPPPPARTLVVRESRARVLERAVRRLEEIRAGDTARRLEVIVDEVTIEGWESEGTDR